MSKTCNPCPSDSEGYLEETVDFGFQDIPISEKRDRVSDVFRRVANRYDLMNDCMSFGMHRMWKWFAVQLCAVRSGFRVLDLAGGTGDITHRLVPILRPKGQIILSDINSAMLDQAKTRLFDAGRADGVYFIEADAECLPFQDAYFDCVIIAFGLRNVTRKEKALQEMCRVLKPGGRLVILEFSHPSGLLQKAYNWYSDALIPKLGRWIARDEDSYRYLIESIRRHPDQNKLLRMMCAAGFEHCQYYNLSGGIVAVHRGYRL